MRSGVPSAGHIVLCWFQLILQSSCIYVIRRDGGTLTFSHPLTETYGENFGYINRIVFGLNSDISDYHKVFSSIYNLNHCNMIDSTEEVISLYHETLECQQLSSQMIAYIAKTAP